VAGPRLRADELFGPKKDEITGEEGIIRNGELIIRVIKLRRLEWAGQVALIRESRCAYRFLGERRPLGRPRHKWGDNIDRDC
jgi:hypothetical protein